MSTYDPSRIDPPGPTGFRRVADWVTRIFRNGGTGPLVTATGTLPPATQTTAGRTVWLAKLNSEYPLSKARATDVTDKLRMWDNDIAPLLLIRLRAAFHPDNYSRMFWVLHISSNVMRRVVNDVSVLYENPASRRLKEAAITQAEAPTDESLSDQKASADNTPQSDPAAGPDDAPQASGVAEGDETPDTPNAGALDTGDEDIDQLAIDLDLSGAKDEAQETPFDKLMKAYDLDLLLDTVEKLCMISPVVWVRPIVTYAKKNEAGENDASSAKLNYQIYTPAEADVVVDPTNPQEAIGFYYFGEELNEKMELVKVIHFFNADIYMKLDLEWKVLATEPNELGRLPVTPFRIYLPRKGYFVEGVGDDLFEATLEVNALKTLQNSRAKDGAFKQLAIQGEAKNLPADLVLGGPSPIILGEENTATVLDFQPQLDQFTTMWEKREESLANTYGINSADYKSEGHPQSGFAKKLDRDKVLKESRRRRKFFAKGEQDLYSLTAKTLDVYPMPSIGKLDATAELELDFAEPTFEEDPQTQAKTDAIELKYNVVSVIDILRRANPDLSDVELIEMAYRNKRINDAFMTSDQFKLTDVLAGAAQQELSFERVQNKGGTGTPPQNLTGGFGGEE